MFDLIAFLKGIATTYFSDVVFLHGSKESVNIDISNITDKVIFFERPYTIEATTTPTMTIEGRFVCNLIFLMPNKYYGVGTSAVNGYQDAIDTSYIEPSQTLMIGFLAALQNQANIVNPIQFKAIDLTDWEEFDNNASGTFCTVTFTIRNIGNFCKAPDIPVPDPEEEETPGDDPAPPLDIEP